MASQPSTGPFKFDAVGFLKSGNGSCTSNGHLFAALMRANGVPCRPVTVIMRGVGQDMHWRNEYFVPGQGWAYIEPQGGNFDSAPQSPRSDAVETGPVEPEMDTSLEVPYFVKFFGEPIDGGGRPIPAETALVLADKGLRVAYPAGDDQMHYFGAT